MARVSFRRKAIDDLNDIWNYTYEIWSEKQADIYYNIIRITCSGIGSNPNVGKRYDEISQDLRGLKIEKHIIFYKHISDNNIEIVRILHERMDLKVRINEKQ